MILSNLLYFNKCAILKKGVFMFLANFFDLKEEKRELKSYFTKMDLNQDGELCFQELVLAYGFKVTSIFCSWFGGFCLFLV